MLWLDDTILMVKGIRKLMWFEFNYHCKSCQGKVFPSVVA